MTPLDVSAPDLAALVAYVSSLGAAPAVATAVGAATAAVSTAPGATAIASATPAASTPRGASAVTATATPLAGGKLYQADGCVACHGPGGKGTARAVPLVDVGHQFSSAQLAALLHAPTAAMTAGGMPPVHGTTAAIASLVAYIKNLKAGGATPGGIVAARAAAPVARAQQPVAAVSQPSTPPPAAATPPPAVAPPPAAAPPIATPASVAVGRPANSPRQRGEALFAARGCTACHGPGGVGTQTGPPLMVLSKSLTPAALTSLLEHPNHKMQSGGMPATNMRAADMSALVAYLQHLGEPVAGPSLASAAPAAPAAPGTTTSPRGTPPANTHATPGDSAGVLVAAKDSSSVASTGGVGVIASRRSMSVLELRGQLVFAAHSCATCHGANGTRGTWAAPALANTGKNFPPALLTGLLQHPTARMRQGGMPTVALSPDELNALVAYVAFISAPKPAPRPTSR